MRIKAVCSTHKNAVVLLLDATTKFRKSHMMEPGDFVDEDSEMATFVELDEANLYCMEGTDRPACSVGFEVVDDSNE